MLVLVIVPPVTCRVCDGNHRPTCRTCWRCTRSRDSLPGGVGPRWATPRGSSPASARRKRRRPDQTDWQDPEVSTGGGCSETALKNRLRNYERF